MKYYDLDIQGREVIDVEASIEDSVIWFAIRGDEACIRL